MKTGAFHMHLTFHRTFALFLTLAIWGPANSPAAGTASNTDRPNILWITCEDTSPDLGCYGDAEARTPNLDKFASQGMLLTHAFSIAGVCAPSRSAIITGMYPTTIGTHHMRCKGIPPAQVKCFTEYLRAVGYYCTNNVKTDYNFDAPLTAWDESSRNAHWQNRPDGAPFFAVINFTTTHESRIRAKDKQFAKLTARLRPADRHDPAKANLPPYYPDTPETRNDWARYYDLVTAMDLRVANVLRQLEEDGLADNTVVFFYGDHGRGLPRGKRWLYDSGLQIPMMIRWPGKIRAGTVSDRLVSFIDLGPTLLSIAGVKVPEYMQGQPFLGQQAAEPREYVFGARDRMDEAYDRIRCVRDKRFKYLRNFEPDKPYAQIIPYMEQMPTMRVWRELHAAGQLDPVQSLFFRRTKPVEELYDTLSDPHEVKDLAGNPEYQEILQRMRSALDDWMKRTGDLGGILEAELWEQRRPGGLWAVSDKPVLRPKGGTFADPVTVTIDCPTEGASIAYTTDVGSKPQWKLYTAPVTLSRSARLRVKSCRLGYKDSPVVTADFTIGSARTAE